MDDRLTALDAKSGKEIWTVKSPEPVTHANGYAMTGAPLVVNGVVITGVAGAEFSHRGLLEGYDAKTGKHLWRTYTIPAKGEAGSETWEGEIDSAPRTIERYSAGNRAAPTSTLRY
jgi:alcohol dehydrogenase (cytochrome c)